MQSTKYKLLSTAMVPLVAMAGVAVVGVAVTGEVAVKPAYAACNPCAAKNPCNPCAAAKCNPCAAAKCNPCNPCAAAACNPCNPCAAAKCNPCNPCSPCAAAKCNPCNPCNPCAAAKCSPCNPCAAGACNPCNPCAAGACNPCNPCAAGGASASWKCAVPRLRTAALCNPCNPCAAAKCNPCNPCSPCAAAKCNPCNPCAAAKCNPCNPCAAAACNPCNPCNPCAAAKCNPCNPCNPCAAANPCNPCGACNPCAAGGGAELTTAEAVSTYDCLKPIMQAAYAKSDNRIAASYASWRRYSTQAYVSATHGGRYVQNYANGKARAYGLYERAGKFPAGAQLAKDSFSVKGNGQVSAGPLFLMEKMRAGFNKASDDWRYTMIMPNGSIFGTTNGRGSNKVQFCIGCHQTVTPEQDSVMLLPEEYRVGR